MPAAWGTAPRIRRPASESLQGRKPRLRDERPCRGCYGDLSATGEQGDLNRTDATSSSTVNRLTDERGMASNTATCRMVCGLWRASGRALSWLGQQKRAGRTDLQEHDAVMRCRS